MRSTLNRRLELRAIQQVVVDQLFNKERWLFDCTKCIGQLCVEQVVFHPRFVGDQIQARMVLYDYRQPQF
jgi:hypothetical protein